MTPKANTVAALAPAQQTQGDLIVFDDICILCSSFGRFIAKHDKTGRFRFVSANTTQGRELYKLNTLDPDAMETNIVIVNGKSHIKMASFAAAMSALGWPWRALAAVDLFPRKMSDWLYDLIARNRYRFGRRACPLPSEELKNRLVDATPSAPLFQQALGPDFDALPRPVQALHAVYDRHHWIGEAKITRGSTIVGALICKIVGFPSAMEKTPVSVTIKRQGNKEIWTRHFGDRKLTSVITRFGTAGAGQIVERFGLFAFNIQLELSKDALHFPVNSGRFLGVPLPRWLLPVSNSCERGVDDRFVFDIAVKLPAIGTLVHYHGWLHPTD